MIPERQKYDYWIDKRFYINNDDLTTAVQKIRDELDLLRAQKVIQEMTQGETIIFPEKKP